LDSGWRETEERLEPPQPCSPGGLPQGAPLCKGILAPHGKIAAGADGNEIFECRRTALAFWNIVAGLEVIGRYHIWAPGGFALRLELPLEMLDPQGLSHGLRNLLFPVVG